MQAVSKWAPLQTKLELDMSLIIESGEKRIHIPIIDPRRWNRSRVRGLNSIPQQVRECPPQAEINIFDEPKQYVVVSELPGVALKNLWVHIEGRTLAIYAGITGEEQEDGEYLYTDKLLGGFRGKIMLPEQAHRRPEKAELDEGLLQLVFPKKTDEFLERLLSAYKL